MAKDKRVGERCGSSNVSRVQDRAARLALYVNPYVNVIILVRYGSNVLWWRRLLHQLISVANPFYPKRLGQSSVGCLEDEPHHRVLLVGVGKVGGGRRGR